MIVHLHHGARQLRQVRVRQRERTGSLSCHTEHGLCSGDPRMTARTRHERERHHRLCVLAQPHVVITSESVLETLLRPDIRLGTSTPQPDPSGDYAWELFRQAERLRPGSLPSLSSPRKDSSY
jgi:hypothetical protein